jgi:VanZ family protein
MAMIYFFSDQPNSNEVTKAVFGDFNYWVRKGAHVSEYAVLFLLTRQAAAKSNIIAFVITVLYACSDEWHQSYVAGRTGTPYDVLIDSIGPTIACGILWLRRRSQSIP